MKVFYSAETIAKHFATVTTYEIAGRQVALIIGQVQSFVISAIDAHATTHECDPTGAPVHQILAEMRINAHYVQDETQYSEAGYWQAEDFKADAMAAMLRATLAARCGITLITGDQLAKVEAEEAAQRRALMNEILEQHRDTFESLAGVTESPEEQARRLQMYKIMRQEPPESIG